MFPGIAPKTISVAVRTTAKTLKSLNMCYKSLKRMYRGMLLAALESLPYAGLCSAETCVQTLLLQPPGPSLSVVLSEQSSTLCKGRSPLAELHPETILLLLH